MLPRRQSWADLEIRSVMRARNIKPGLFKNETLAELSLAARLLFIGLWCMADREGRLEDRPKRIKAELFPYDDLDVEPLLAGLAAVGFIERYEVGGLPYIQVVNFKKHQSPHYKERESTIPAPDKPQASTGLALPDSLIPDSGLLIPDSLKCAEAPHDVQYLVALYVDHHVALGRTKPDRRRVGVAAKAIKEQLDLGADPEVLAQAIRQLVSDAKSPSMLGLKLGDVERERSKTGGTNYPKGRSIHGEF